MLDFLTWSWPARLGIVVLLGLCVLAQTLAMLLRFYSRKRLQALLEFVLLVLVLLGSLLYGQVLYSGELGLLVQPLVNVDARVFAAALPLLLGRGIGVCLRSLKQLRTGISALSIKNAIDSLHSGILFGAQDGRILLSNARMQQLMVTLTGKVRRDGWEFYNILLRDEMRPGCRKTQFEGKIVCLLPDDTAWMFTRTQLLIREKSYIQLTAANITQRWALTAQLQQQNAQLHQRSAELKQAIASLHELSREREVQRARMRVHDILGQRMTLLLRLVRRGQTLDGELLAQLSKSLLEDLKPAQAEPSPMDFLKSLQREFAAAGVMIRLAGAPPKEDRLYADIVREAVTNAVRHGFATEIYIETMHTANGCRIRITNNGTPPESFAPGGGLTGMRERVEACGGILRAAAKPNFTLEIDLPGSDDCV